MSFSSDKVILLYNLPVHLKRGLEKDTINDTSVVILRSWIKVQYQWGQRDLMPGSMWKRIDHLNNEVMTQPTKNLCISSRIRSMASRWNMMTYKTASESRQKNKRETKPKWTDLVVLSTNQKDGGLRGATETRWWIHQHPKCIVEIALTKMCRPLWKE